MRVLWITLTVGNYKKGSIKGTGGWIAAIRAELIQRYPELTLYITFVSSDFELLEEGDVTYFPVCTTDFTIISTRGIDCLINSEDYCLFRFAQEVKIVMDDYKPDVVPAWGIEVPLAELIPFVIRPLVYVQGIIARNKLYLPPSFSPVDLLRASRPLNPHSWSKSIVGKTSMRTKEDIERYLKGTLAVASGRQEAETACSDSDIIMINMTVIDGELSREEIEFKGNSSRIFLIIVKSEERRAA